MKIDLVPLTPENADEPCTLKFHVGAGILIRRRIEAAIRRAALWNDLKLDMIEDKGLLDSVFTVKASGPHRKIRQFASAVSDLQADME